MNYIKHYELLIYRAKNREIVEGYTENHHIIPTCLNGPNTSENKVKLTAREHFIAHAVLAKIYKGTSHGHKLISAFRYMSVDSHSGQRNNNRDYSWMRKMYSENHPCRTEFVKEKIRISLKKFRDAHPNWKETLRESARLYRERNPDWCKHRKERINVICECGCGESFEKIITSDKRFIYGHHVIQTEERKNKISKKMKDNISALSDNKKIERLEKSLWNCDNVKRGESISTSKKGKKTNQPFLDSERYSNMSEEEFSKYIEGRAKNIKSRMATRRTEGLLRRHNGIDIG